MYIVYVLEHSVSQLSYVGFTTDLKRRIREHNARGKKFTTRKNGQWILIYAEAYRNESDARERESKLKIHGSAMVSLLKRLKKKSFEPKVGRDAAKVSLATVYQKHSSLRTRKRMYRG